MTPPLFPPPNHSWGFTRTGRSGPNHCAQGENVALLIYPPRIGRTDLSDAKAVSGPAIRTIARPYPLPVPPLFPPHNHRWGFTRTGRSGPNHCAQGENVALFVYPPHIGRTDRSDAQTVSGPIIRTIARPHPLPVPPLFPPSCLSWG